MRLDSFPEKKVENPPRLSLIKFIQLSHVFFRQLQVEHIDIALYAACISTFWYHDYVLLHQMAQ